MDMDSWKAMQMICEDYVSQMRTAQQNDDWDEMNALRREMKRNQRELGQIMAAVDVFHRYGLKL